MLELIMVILIIAILVTLAVPEFEKMKERAITVEALKILRTEQDIRQNLGERPSTAYFETKYWKIQHAGATFYGINEQWCYIYATRKSGPYAGKHIVVFWRSGRAEFYYSGTHPYTPKEPAWPGF